MAVANRVASSGELKHAVIRHSKWAVLGRLVSMLAATVSSFLLARMLTKGDFGRLSVIQTAVVGFGLMGSFGLGTVSARMLSVHSGRLRRPAVRQITLSLIRVGLVAGVVASTLGFLFWMGLGQRLLGAPISATLCVVLALAVMFRAFTFSSSDLLRATDDPRTANLVGGPNGGVVLQGLLVLLCSAFYLLGALDWQTAVLAFCGATFLSAIFTFAEGRMWRYLPRFRHTNATTRREPIGNATDGEVGQVRAAATVGFSVMTAAIVMFIVNQGEVLFPGFFLDEVDVANYVAAKKLVLLISIPFTVANMAVTGLIPKLYQEKKHEQLSKIVRSASSLASIPCISLALLCLVFPETVLSLLFGSEYATAASLVRILSLAQIAVALTGSCGKLLANTKHERAVLIISVASAAIMILTGYLAITKLGIHGFAWTIAAVVATQNIVQCYVAYRLLGIATVPSPRLIRDGFRQAVNQVRG